MDKVLVLVFKKTNGKSYKFTVSYPSESIERQNIVNFAGILISKRILEFKDNSPLQELEKAYYQEVKREEVVLA